MTILDLDVHPDVVSVEAVIVKKVVIDTIEIEKEKEQEKGNVIAVKGNENVSEGKEIEQFVKENVSVIDADKENEKTDHHLEKSKFLLVNLLVIVLM